MGQPCITGLFGVPPTNKMVGRGGTKQVFSMRVVNFVPPVPLYNNEGGTALAQCWRGCPTRPTRPTSNWIWVSLNVELFFYC